MAPATAPREPLVDADADGDVLSLDDDAATDPERTGGKAAALARARRSGLPTLPGAVLTTAFCRTIDRGAAIEHHPAVTGLLDRLDVGDTRLVARSSSVVEDAADSSAAGQFESVLDIRGDDALRDAVRTVLASREQAGAQDHPIAVLVQPMLEPRWGGVRFGVDPVTGRSDRQVVTAVAGQPDPLVSGEVTGARYVLDGDGVTVESDPTDDVDLAAEVLAAIADLGARADEAFGSPQDIEWAVDDGGDVVLLQSRPVTTEVRGVPRGPVYGPGPVAETFPGRLGRLAADLWVEPLSEAVGAALELSGARTPAPGGHDLVICLDGQVAIDLEATGEVPRTDRPPWYRITEKIRYLRSAWRIGRLRAALPALARRLVERTDSDLGTIPALDDLADRQLVALLGRSSRALVALHAHEILMGRMVDTSSKRLTGTSVAMRVLAEERARGRDDDAIVARSPIVLALAPPRIGPEPCLPGGQDIPDLPAGTPATERAASDDVDPAVLREALRLRVRWVQEVGARAAWTLGERLAAAGHLPQPSCIAELGLDDVVAVAARRAEVVASLLPDDDRPGAEALPARFRVSDRGRPIPVESDGTGAGTGASGGVATGVVSHDTDDPPHGSILVVRTLAPELGPMLGRLSGLVAETGSVLAHLAILAREQELPTVVGRSEALDDLPEGVTVTIDGDTGDVRRDDEPDDVSDGQEDAA